MNSQHVKGYIVDIDSGERLEFQYNPGSITDEKSTSYATIKIPGMSHPKYQYVSGEPRRIAFKIEFFKGPVKQKVDWLRSLQYPEHVGSMLKNAPPRIIFIFGDLYPGITCIVKQVKVRYFGLFDQATLNPQRAEVDISLEEYVDQSVNKSEVF